MHRTSSAQRGSAGTIRKRLNTLRLKQFERVREKLVGMPTYRQRESEIKRKNKAKRRKANKVAKASRRRNRR